MLKSLLSISLLASSIFCFGQKYIRPYVGVNFSNRILRSDDADRKDSLNKADKYKISPSFGVQFLFEKQSGTEFYLGAAYFETGFVRERFDYQFLDTVHPDLAPIFDLSQGAQKNGFFTYHFKYLEIPFGFNFQVTPRQNMHNYIGWFNFGLNPQFLLKQNMTIFLEGFSIKGENRFNFSETGYNASKFNVAFQLGGRFDYTLDKKTWVSVDGLFKIHVLNTASTSNETFRSWNFNFNLGIRREIGN